MTCKKSKFERVAHACINYIRGPALMDFIPLLAIGLAAYIGYDYIRSSGDLDAQQFILVKKVIGAILALVVLRLFTMALNNIKGFRVRDWFKSEATPEMAKGIYLAAEVLGICYLVAAIINQ